MTLAPRRRVVRAGRPPPLAGAAPGAAGSLVQAELKRGRQWIRVGETSASGDGSFSVSVRIGKPGRAKLRALVPTAGVSRAVTVTVR